jgi:antitoxin component YwqK of YwqJK toxin-antitoxin module
MSSNNTITAIIADLFCLHKIPDDTLHLCLSFIIEKYVIDVICEDDTANLEFLYVNYDDGKSGVYSTSVDDTEFVTEVTETNNVITRKHTTIQSGIVSSIEINKSEGSYIDNWEGTDIKRDTGTCINERRHHGERKLWYLNGRCAIVCNYKNGIRHGLYKSWYSDGQTAAIKKYINGKLEGEMLEFYPNGKIQNIYKYTRDILIDSYEWLPNDDLHIKRYEKIRGVYKLARISTYSLTSAKSTPVELSAELVTMEFWYRVGEYDGVNFILSLTSHKH